MKCAACVPLLLVVLNMAAVAEQPSAAGTGSPAEAEVMKLLDEYMSAWNRADLAAWERTFQFPHYRLASGKMTVLQRPGDQPRPKMWNTDESDWHHSGWDRRRIVHASGEKIHVDTKFTRYRADGSKIGSYDSLYILTKENGQWGVKMRSSFAR